MGTLSWLFASVTVVRVLTGGHRTTFTVRDKFSDTSLGKTAAILDLGVVFRCSYPLSLSQYPKEALFKVW